MSSQFNDGKDSNFLDSRTLMAIVLVGIVWFGWQTYLAKKYPDARKDQVAATTQNPATTGTPNPAATAKETPVETTVIQKSNSAIVLEEKTISYEDKNVSFNMSSQGMSLKEFTLKNHKNRAHEPMKMGITTDNKGLFSLSLLDVVEPLHFNITKKSENIFQGIAQVGSMKITREIEINPETEALTNRVFIENAAPDFRGLSISFPEKRVDYSGGGNFLIPSFEHQEFTVLHEGTETRLNSTSSKETMNQTFSNVSLVAINSQYFSSALLDKSEIIPEVKVIGGLPQDQLLSTLSYRLTPSNKTDYKFEWIAYSGAKSMDILAKIDPVMTKVINHGFFAAIARTLLVLLKWFHSVVGNWGVSIILLTLLVRILVLPLNITTFRSTKKMQKIQPKIAALRERLKDDPAQMNKEMMALWKENKVNPVGGCLPMLLQLPVFFALYQVLGQSIELYQAPFFLWITDLSLKDPFYILPVLMAGAMYIQQKMTPTTLDPTQTKIMQFLPLIFAFMMISLPAGLTLYILVNTVTGVALQQLFMRDRTSTTQVPSKSAKA